METHQQRQLMKPIILIVFLDLLGFGIVLPIVAPLFLVAGGVLPAGTAFATRTILLGLLIASYPASQFFGAPILGALVDRHGRKPILQLSLIGTLLGYIVFAFGIMTHGLLLLFIGRLLDGFTGGNISVANSAIADISDEKSKPRNFGLVGMAFGLGFILGPFIGGKLSDPTLVPWFTFATPFWFAAALCAFNMLYVQWKFPETIRERRHADVSAFTGFRNLAKAFSLPNLRTLFIVSFLLSFGFNFFTQFFQVFMVEKFLFTQSRIGDLFAYIGLWIAFSQGVLTGRVARRYPPAKILEVSLLVLGLVLPLLVLPRHAFTLLAIIPLIAIAFGLTNPSMTALVSSAAGIESQGEVLGLQQSILAAAMAIPPLISGFVVAVHANLPILIGAASVLAAWAVFVFVYRERRTEKFHEI